MADESLFAGNTSETSDAEEQKALPRHCERANMHAVCSDLIHAVRGEYILIQYTTKDHVGVELTRGD